VSGGADRGWTPKKGRCPKVLGISLWRPWSWAFFEGPPEGWKDVENRTAGFPVVEPGTVLVLHNTAKWHEPSRLTIVERIPECAHLTKKDLPAGYLVGVVRVEQVVKGHLLEPRASRWRMDDKDVGVWLQPGRVRLAKPIPFNGGWFNAWTLPELVQRELYHSLQGMAEAAQRSGRADAVLEAFARDVRPAA
jgi:hypothetical protein